MRAVQIVLDDALLRAADCGARRERVNRTALVREALHKYLQQIETSEAELLDRKGCLRLRDSGTSALKWEHVAASPRD